MSDLPPDGFVPRVPTCSHFYKYSNAEHLDWLRDILLKHEVYFPSHPELNDPRDGWAMLKQLSVEQVASFLVNDFLTRNAHREFEWLAREVGKILYGAKRFGASVLVDMLEKRLRQETERNRIYSLSMALESPYIWRKYGGNHTGYCLEFANDGLFRIAHEVHYDDELGRPDPTDPRSFFMYRKTFQWHDEEEARVVMFPRGGPEFFTFFKKGEDPFVSFDPHLLRRVILGKHMSQSNRDQIRAWAAERNPPVVVVDSDVG